MLSGTPKQIASPTHRTELGMCMTTGIVSTFSTSQRYGATLYGVVASGVTNEYD